MEYLYAPWRDSYVVKKKPTKKGCIFCLQHKDQEDEKNFILKRFDHCFVVLNLFPYNAGHLMIIPYRHTAHLNTLTQQARSELMDATSLSTDILKKTLDPDAFNIGTNVGGKAGGGSIAHHLHIHIVPRWFGDTSFLTTISDTKPISIDLQRIYHQLAAIFQQVNP